MTEQRRIEEAQSYASDIGVLGVLQALTRLRGLILLPVIARALGTGAFGAWTQALVAVSLGSAIVGIQLHIALVRFVSGTGDREEQRSYFAPILLVVAGVGGLAAAVTAVFPELFAARVLGDVVYTPIAVWLGTWIGITAIGQMGLHMLRALQRVKLYGLLNTLQTLAQLAIVALVVLIWRDLRLAVLGAIAMDLLFALGVQALVFREIGLGWPGFGRLRSALQFSLPLVPSHYASVTLAFADRLVIASLLGAEAVGVYAAAYSLARVVREIYKPVSAALLPAVSRVWDRGDRDQGRWLLSNTVRYYLLLALPALAGTTALGSTVLRYLAPDVVTPEITWIVALVGLGITLTSLQDVFAVMLQLIKETRVLAAARLVSALVYVLLIGLAVPRWGLVGGAAATAAGYGIDMLIILRLARRRERFELPLAHVGKALLAIGGMLAVVVPLNALGGIWGFISAVAAGAVAYLAVMLLLGGVGRRELGFLLRAVGMGESAAPGP